MNRSIPRAAVLGALLGAVATAQHPAPRTQDAFLPNLGQWEAVVNHYVHHGLMQVWFTDTGYTLQVTESLTPPDPGRNLGREPAPDLRAVALRATLLGSTGPASRRGVDAADGRYHFFLGNDPQRWVTDAPGYSQLRYEGVWPGVDLLWRFDDGVLTYDFELQPFVDPATLRIRLQGQDRLQIRDDGSLAAVTGMGELRHSAPIAFQRDEAGERRSVPCRFHILEPGVYGFVVEGRDPTLPLVIDPGLSWSTFLGGFNVDSVGLYNALTVAVNGDVITGGSTFAGTGFPWTPGAVNITWSGDQDGWVTRLSASGAMVWSALIGGVDFDNVLAIDTEANGDVTFAGRTDSWNWPTTTGAFQTVFGGLGPRTIGDGFVSRLSADGSQILWSTYLGGAVGEAVRALRLHASGVVVVAGWTGSANFPTAGSPYQPSLAPTTTGCLENDDGFVAVLDPRITGAAQLVASTYLGGGCDEMATHMELDGDTVWVSGGTQSSNFPTTANGYQTTFGGGPNPSLLADGVLVQLPLALNTLTYATYFGGPGDEDSRMTLDPRGRPVFGGWTDTTTLPTTTGAFQPGYQGGFVDSYLAILDPALPPAQQVVYCTYLGGTVGDGVNDIAVERSGLITVTGSVNSGDYPTTPGAYSGTLGGTADGFVTRIDPDMSGAEQLIYSTYLGGSLSWDYGYCIELTTTGAAVVAGRTGSANFPTTPGAFQPNYGGGTRDAFVTVVDMLPAGVSRYGAPSPLCHGPLYLSVNSEPVASNVGFAILVNEAPPNSFGALFLGHPDVTGTPLPFGFTAHLLVGQPMFSANATSDGLGYSRIPVPLPANFTWPFGGLQTVWAAPGGCAPLVASDALR